VILVSYNHEEFIGQAVRAAVAQTFRGLRIVIIDDCSTDGSRDAIRRAVAETGADATVLFNPVNLGLCPTLNRALSFVDTDYVALIACDDWMLPTRVERQVARLEELGPAYGAAYSDFYFVDGDSTVPRAETARADVDCPEGDLFDELLEHNVIPAPTVMMRRSVIDDVGAYDPALGSEDYDMWLRIARKYRWAFVDEPLVCYRVLEVSLTTTLGRTGLRASNVGALIKHLDADTAGVLVPRLEPSVRSLYLAGRSPRETARDLRRIARLRPTRRTLLYLVAATLGIPGRRLSRGGGA